MSVSLVNGEWDISWLGSQVRHLSTTASPTWNGNTVLAGNVWDASNNPGPFANLSDLSYGDKIQIHMNGTIFTYHVQENCVSFPDDLSAIEHQALDSWS